MDTRITTLVTELGHGQCLKVRRATGALLRVDAGAAWITEAGRRADAVLSCGASYRVERGRAVVIEAIGATRVAITPLRPVVLRTSTPFDAAVLTRRFVAALLRAASRGAPARADQ